MRPDIWEYKANQDYHFWTRSVIGYDEEQCDVPIEGAIAMLQDMRHAGTKHNLTMATLVCYFVYAGICTLVYCCLC